MPGGGLWWDPTRGQGGGGGFGGGGTNQATGAGCDGSGWWNPIPSPQGTLGQGQACQVCPSCPQPVPVTGFKPSAIDQGGEAVGGFDTFQAGSGFDSGQPPLSYDYPVDLTSIPSGARGAWVLTQYRSEGDETDATITDNGGSQGNVTAPTDAYIHWNAGAVASANAAIGTNSLVVHAEETFDELYGNFYTVYWSMGYYTTP